MKIRTPTLDKKPDWKPDTESSLYSITYQVKTITPIYGGGVEAGVVDPDMPIRAAGIRGQLRYWWRFLQSNRKDDKRLEGKELYDAERAIWGGMKTNRDGNDKKDCDAAGKVSVHVVINTKSQSENCNTLANNRPGIQYALFSAIQNDHELQDKEVKFTLDLRAYKKEPNNESKACNRGLTQEQWDSVFLTVRWWVNFCGIGARTRRGLGAIEVEGIASLSEEEVDAYGCKLKMLNSANDSIQAWNSAIEKLFQFRQGRGIGLGREQGNDNRPGRSHWPEPDTIRTLTHRHGHPVNHEAVGSFPRAMFGLPIIFEIRGHGEPPKTHLLPDGIDSSRMASPLIIKPVADGNGNYIPTALLLPTKHLDDLHVKLDKTEGKRRSWGVFDRNGNKAWWPSQEQEQRAKAKKIEPMRERHHDPLHAFLKFFEEG
ncbi:MAG: type III-B CRISPR module RAMP protein Cmr1 [Candidatus Thiodiazotropha sp. (ex Lucinoma borealis)]|nr:type III-B CRISPR module RAMP protein Cmr1 [Candidatus Thiodiazotropha sp. (ex Lucinoma borealis)]